MSNNIYNILGKLKGITDTAAPTTETTAETVYENVEPRGSITEAVKSLESKFAKFNESAKPDFLDVDKDGDKAEPFKKAIKDKKKTVKEGADAATQKGAQAILQALSPEEEQQLASIVKQAGNDPKRVIQALGITQQDVEQPQVAEGIAPDLKGKIIQALYTAGVLGTTVGAVATGNPWLGTIAAPLLMAANAMFGDAPGQLGHKPRQQTPMSEGQGPYELYNPKHPKFKANYDKYKAKHPDCTLAEFVAAMKKREAKMNEAAYDEPEAPNADAVAKRKRLQALKDRQEDERDSYSDTKSNVRKIPGKAYGGAAQKDEPEVDEGTIAKPKKDLRKHSATAKRMAMQKKADKGHEEWLDHLEKTDPDHPSLKYRKQSALDEVAPPGAKAERMVKGIKKGYAKDGKLTKKEKGIAYATAWKAHNKGQVEEGVQFGDKIDNSKAEMKKAKPAMVKESRVMEETDYFYEKVAKSLCGKNPNLDTASSDFAAAVRKEMIAQGIEPNRARGILLTDEDFLGDVATSYGHYCKELAETGAPVNSFLGGVEELDEIARLAGIESPMKEAELGHDIGLERSESDLDEVTAPPLATPGKAPAAKATGMAPAKGNVPPTPTFNEEEVEEGNEFSGALAAAKASGAKEFEVDGKKYTVKEDINVNITANGQEDALNLFRKLAGMSEVTPAVTGVAVPVDAETAIAQGMVEPVEVEVDEERDIEYANTPNEKIGPVGSAVPSGDDLHRSKKQFRKEYPGDNPMAVQESAEDSLWKKYSGMLKSLIIK